MKRLKLTILLIIAFSSYLNAQNILDDVSKGFKLGKAELISPHLSEEVEMITPEDAGTFSKDMTTKKLTSFFSSNMTTKFEMVHQGKSPSGSTYHIGQLDTEKNHYRIYILLSGKEIRKISELRVELDD